MESEWSSNREVYACFIDLTKAFDRVQRHRIWESLNRRGIPRTLIQKIQMMYEGGATKLFINGKKTRKIHIGRGIKQGSA